MKKDEKRIVYLLESIDLENLTGVLKIKYEEPKNAPWKSINVTIGALLAYRHKNQRLKELDGLQYVGTRFVSSLKSPIFKQNPFKLVKFIPTGESDIPENYHLELVTDRFTPFTEVNDALGGKVRFIKEWLETHPTKFMRYMEFETSKKLSELKVSIVIP